MRKMFLVLRLLRAKVHSVGNGLIGIIKLEIDQLIRIQLMQLFQTLFCKIFYSFAILVFRLRTFSTPHLHNISSLFYFRNYLVLFNFKYSPYFCLLILTTYINLTALCPLIVIEIFDRISPPCQILERVLVLPNMFCCREKLCFGHFGI